MASAPKQMPPLPSSEPRRPRWAQCLPAAVAFAVVTVVLVIGARRSIPPENVCPDFIQFWTAATLLSSRQDPYDAALQAAVQQDLGWKRDEDGLGVYDFLPYYYPPWLGLAFVPLLPLGYPLAKLTWLVLGAEVVLVSAALLAKTARGVSQPLAIAVVGLFGFSIKAVAMGQLAPLVLLLLAIEWWLLERGRHREAGFVLALLTMKPQLTLLLTIAVLLRAARQRHWQLWRSFGVTLLLFVAASTIAWPGWLPSMLSATRITPMPTHYYPGLGATWLVTLGAIGLSDFPLYLAYASIAVPLLLALLRMTQRADARLEELFSLALLAPFFVAPYARPYDFPVLMIPALVLMGSRLGELARLLLAFALTALVGLHIIWLTANYVTPVVGLRRPEFSYFWIPMLLGAFWLFHRGHGSRKGAPANRS